MRTFTVRSASPDLCPDSWPLVQQPSRSIEVAADLAAARGDWRLAENLSWQAHAARQEAGR